MFVRVFPLFIARVLRIMCQLLLAVKSTFHRETSVKPEQNEKVSSRLTEQDAATDCYWWLSWGRDGILLPILSVSWFYEECGHHDRMHPIVDRCTTYRSNSGLRTQLFREVRSTLVKPSVDYGGQNFQLDLQIHNLDGNKLPMRQLHYLQTQQQTVYPISISCAANLKHEGTLPLDRGTYKETYGAYGMLRFSKPRKDRYRSLFSGPKISSAFLRVSWFKM